MLFLSVSEIHVNDIDYNSNKSRMTTSDNTQRAHIPDLSNVHLESGRLDQIEKVFHSLELFEPV